MFSNNLIIGLGGQGGRSVAAFRREMVKNRHDAEEIKRLGVRIQYLYIDSSRDQLKDDKQWEQYGQDVSLSEGDWIGMDVKSPISALSVRPNIRPWLGELEAQMAKGGKKSGSGNVQAIRGAGQLRRYGRALFAEHAQSIYDKIAQKLQLLLSAGTANPSICFHVFCTLGGGTGSGGLIDLLTLINRLAPKYTQGEITVMVYCYVAGDAQEANNVGYFYENEYAALRDLNALACRRYHPYLAALLNNEGKSFYSDDGLVAPISQVFLSSEFTTNTRIKEQVEHMAKGCFNMIVTQRSLDATIQKGFSGEDLIQGKEGEDPGDVKQSYRFAGMATKSWYVPISQIKEMLKRKHEERVCQMWLDGSGKYHQRPEDAAKAYVEKEVLSNSYQTQLTELVEQKKKELTDYCNKLIEDGDRGVDTLHQFAEWGKKYYRKLQASPLEPSERARAEEECRQMVSLIMEKVRALITEKVQWKGGATNEIWGLRHAKEYVRKLIDCIQTNIETGELSFTKDDESEVHTNLAEREEQWEKLGIFSRVFAKLDEKMLQQHCQDMMLFVSIPLKVVKSELQKDFYNALIASLQVVDNRLESIIQGISGVRTNAREEAEKLEFSLGSNQHISNYEVHDLDREMMNKVLEAMVNEDMRPYLVRYNEQWTQVFTPIDKCTEFSAQELAMKLSASFYDDAEKIHDAACSRNATLRSLLVASILERLNSKAGPDKSMWHKTLLPDIKDFLKHMPVSVALNRNGTFLTEPQVAMQGVVALGFPEDARYNELAEWMAEQFRANWPTSLTVRGSGFGVYRHKSPEVIRLMYVPHWFPARFASVVERLYDKYSKSARDEDGVVKRYFANLDDAGADLPPKERVELVGRERSNETLLWDIELAKKITMSDSSGTSWALLSEDPTSGKIVIMNTSRIGEYGNRYTSAEKEYPSVDFSNELKAALRVAIDQMDGEAKSAIESTYKSKQQEARASGVSDASDEGAAIQQELNYVRKKLGI